MQTNPTTRRALLTGGARVAAYAAGAAIVGGAVAVADAKGAELPAADRLTSEEAHAAAVALEPFAMAWLIEWRQHGGSVIENVAGDGYVHGWPEYDYSPDAVRQKQTLIDAGLDEAKRAEFYDRDYAWYSAHHHGRMRALSDLLKQVDGGSDAVTRIVKSIPELGWPIRETLA